MTCYRHSSTTIDPACSPPNSATTKGKSKNATATRTSPPPMRSSNPYPMPQARVAVDPRLYQSPNSQLAAEAQTTPSGRRIQCAVERHGLSRSLNITNQFCTQKSDPHSENYSMRDHVSLPTVYRNQMLVTNAFSCGDKHVYSQRQRIYSQTRMHLYYTWHLISTVHSGKYVQYETSISGSTLQGIR